MSEALELSGTMTQPTKWDALANPGVLETPSVPETLDISNIAETPTEKIDLNNIDPNNLNRAEISQLEKQLGEMLAASAKEINEHQLIIENIRKRQATISSIMHGLAELKRLQNEADNFPFVLTNSKATAEPAPSVTAEPTPAPTPTPEAKPTPTKPEPEPTPTPTKPEPTPEAKPIASAKKSAIELYKEMLERRVDDGNLKPEEANTLLERVQAKVSANTTKPSVTAEPTLAPTPTPEAKPTPTKPEPAPEGSVVSQPEETTDENTDWSDWTGISEEDWKRYIEWSKSKDEQNMQNLEARDSRYVEIIKESLAERERKEAKAAALAKATAPTEAEPTPEEVDSEEPQWDKPAKDFSSTEELEAELEKMRKIIAENSRDSGLFFVGDNESITEISPSVESMQLKVPKNIKEKMDKLKAERLKEKNSQNYAKIEQKAKALKEKIEQNYDLIGGEEGIKLLNPQPNDVDTKVADYDRWWSSLSDQGRQKIDEIVRDAEQGKILDYSTISPINLAFLSWYHELMGR